MYHQLVLKLHHNQAWAMILRNADWLSQRVKWNDVLWIKLSNESFFALTEPAPPAWDVHMTNAMRADEQVFEMNPVGFFNLLFEIYVSRGLYLDRQCKSVLFIQNFARDQVNWHWYWQYWHHNWWYLQALVLTARLLNEYSVDWQTCFTFVSFFSLDS